MSAVHRRRVLVVAWLAVSGCGATGGARDGGADAGLGGACGRAPGLLDGGADAGEVCASARAQVECALSNGDTELCLSDDPSTCPGTVPMAGVTRTHCFDRCAASEYGATCAGGPSHAAPSPPPGCTSLGAVPAGATLYCCPCQ
jgi:hypothetical protein